MKENVEQEQTQSFGTDDWLPVSASAKTQRKELLKPPGQLQLTEKELNEEITRILNGNNPHAPHNIARFNHKERTFKASPNVDHLVIHFEFDGYLVYKGDEEETVEGEGAIFPTDTDDKKKVLLRNQFNFSERASQTSNNPVRVSNV